MRKPSLLATWGWFIAKNLVGWALIVSSVPLGALIPGPGGIPLFLIGFGLVTFPGKRRFTARVLRGKPIPPRSLSYVITVSIISLGLVAVATAYLRNHTISLELPTVEPGKLLKEERWITLAVVLSVTVLIVGGILARPLVNKVIGTFPRIRRKIRPYLRRRGIDLLPPRRRQRIAVREGEPELATDPEIIEIHERHLTRFRRAWKIAKPWVRGILGFGITVAIFVLICRPIWRRWPLISDRIATIHWTRFFLAASMFAAFLFVFRTIVWRRILIGFGHELPIAPATRIWSTSELARYLPGVIWQVAGRAYLVKPYGVRGSHCSASQILELSIFLLANLLIAIACLVWLGIKQFSGATERWLYVAMALVPVLVFLLHPRVLYPLMNGILRKLRKPPVATQMGFRTLASLLVWSMVGLVWQGLAIWLLVEEPLNGLPIAKWWVVAGAYCLAWCAGFLAFWAQGGLGVRELVFIGALSVALPPAIRARFTDQDQLTAVIMFLSVLLRLWATAGELILASIAYALDWEGATRRRRTPV